MRRLTTACMRIALIACAMSTAAARGADFHSYPQDPTSSFEFPLIVDQESQGAVVFDNLSDGRVLAISTLITDSSNFLGTPKVYLETAIGSRSFQLLGDLPLPPGALWSTGGAFLSVSPGGSGDRRIAVGNNENLPYVGVFKESDLLNLGVGGMPLSWYETPHSSAAWRDDRHLAVISGDFLTSQVHLLDTDSATGSPVRPLILSGMEGASGGIGFDSAGNLYTANGFANGDGSATGHIRKFTAAEIDAALLGSVLNFEVDGTGVETLLSGGSLVFDREDNLLVGGSDFFGGGQSNFFALLPGPDISGTTRMFDPDSTSESYYVLAYNEVQGEIYAYQPFAMEFDPEFNNRLVYVYALENFSNLVIPEPTTIVLLTLGMVGLVAWRHRRRK